MRTTSLFTACVLCLAASGSVQGISKGGWEDDRRNYPTNPGTIR